MVVVLVVDVPEELRRDASAVGERDGVLGGVVRRHWQAVFQGYAAVPRNSNRTECILWTIRLLIRRDPFCKDQIHHGCDGLGCCTRASKVDRSGHIQEVANDTHLFQLRCAKLPHQKHRAKLTQCYGWPRGNTRGHHI